MRAGGLGRSRVEEGRSCGLFDIQCVRLSIHVGHLRRLGLRLQLPLRAGTVYKVQTTTQTVHALAHVVQREREPERAVGWDGDGGGPEQRHPVTRSRLFRRLEIIGAERGDGDSSRTLSGISTRIQQNHCGLFLTVLVVTVGVFVCVCVCSRKG